MCVGGCVCVSVCVCLCDIYVYAYIYRVLKVHQTVFSMEGLWVEETW